MGCCNGTLAKQGRYTHDGKSQSAELVADFQEIGPPSPSLDTNGHLSGHLSGEILVFDGIGGSGNSTPDLSASWVPSTSVGVRHLAAVHEEEQSITDSKETRESRPVLQRVPSGDSFHSCISHESVMLRIWSGVPQGPGPLQEKIDDEAHSTTSTQITQTRQTVSHQVLDIQHRSITCPLPTAGAAGAGSLPSGESSFNLGNSIAMRSGLGNSDTLGASATASAIMGGRASRTLGKRLSSIRHSIRRGQTDPGTIGRHSKRNAGLAHNGQVTPKKRGNPNMPRDYIWLSELLVMICDNEAGGVGSMDRNNKDALRATPLFVVCGACPSSWASMQAVLFSAVGQGQGSVDFWWIKPRKNAPEILERLTLDRWSKGPYKNDPGRSKSIYKPLADLFSHSHKKDDQIFTFGMEASSAGGSCLRAFIEDPRVTPPGRYYLYLVWQEEWTQNPLASNKFIKGKIVYQREPERGAAAVIFIREYCISNGKLHLSEIEEPAGDVLPGATLKEIGTL